MYKLDLGKAEEPEIKWPTSVGSSKKWYFQKNIYFCFIENAKAFDCVDHNKPWKILRDRNSIPLYLSFEKSLCRSRSNSYNQMWNNRLIPNRERSTSRLYIVTLLILLICRVHHVKCQAGWVTSWNQDFQEKYQQPQMCRWYHSNSRKWRANKKPLDKGEEESEKTDLKFNIQKTKIMASGPVTSWQIDGENVEAVTDFILLGSKITVDSDCNHEC